MENKIVCAWCKKVIKEGVDPISHGICEECCEEEIKKLDEQKARINAKEEYNRNQQNLIIQGLAYHVEQIVNGGYNVCQS